MFKKGKWQTIFFVYSFVGSIIALAISEVFFKQFKALPINLQWAVFGFLALGGITVLINWLSMMFDSLRQRKYFWFVAVLFGYCFGAWLYFLTSYKKAGSPSEN